MNSSPHLKSSLPDDVIFLFSLLDEHGFPDLRLLPEMNRNKETLPVLSGHYNATEFLDAGFLIYGMNRPIKRTAYRKLPWDDLMFSIDPVENTITYDAIYSLNNSELDPYIVPATVTASIDQIVISYRAPNQTVASNDLLLARYERSFMLGREDVTQIGWLASMELRISRKDLPLRYPYALYRTMDVLRKFVIGKELNFERDHPEHPPLAIARLLPGNDQINLIPKDLLTPEALGRLYVEMRYRGDTIDPEQLARDVTAINAMFDATY